MLDTVLRGGQVVDGTGAARRPADVGISGGRVVAVGEVGEARRTIDVDGLVVAPGFCDIHTHFDAQVFWDTALTPSSLHGVTSAMAGNCGFTLQPLDGTAADYLVRMLAVVEGMPLEALQAGVPCDWTHHRRRTSTGSRAAWPSTPASWSATAPCAGSSWGRPRPSARPPPPRSTPC